MDVGRTPRRMPQHDPQGLFAAVHLERNHLAVLRLDLPLGLGRSDDALDARVVDLARQPEPRIGLAAAVGQLGVGVKEIIVGVRGRVQEPVDRLRLAPAVELLPFDPRQLGQRVDQLGLGALLRELFHVKHRQVAVFAADVAAILVVEIVPPERLDRSLAGTIDARNAPLQTRSSRDLLGWAGS